MPRLEENFNLKKFNSFGIDANCKFYFQFENTDELIELIKKNNLIESKFFILGGGSNILFTENFDGLVIHPNIKGIEIVKETQEHVYVKVGANENWDEFVNWAVEKNYQGIENLSAIPGVVGATPVQNIGAYGVEAKDNIELVEGVLIENGQELSLSNDECEFGYRDSIFKNSFKNEFVVCFVYFRLNKKHEYNLSYGNVENELRKNHSKINLANIRKSIIKIRESKIPDPKLLPNAGSFYKNPIINANKFEKLKAKFPDIKYYELENSEYKIPAGWLVEKCNWKGVIENNVGVHKDQALIIINYNNAKGDEIVVFSNKIKKSVLFEFGIMLEQEVISI
ncbi:MAG: UDP-N-acetylmuramate dehydrogenase [Marinifilaceae bacterium]|jgi:UDP-N-acetylmuramate dehydrogenase|nr:UDP-N-acetylmuramate dehydrogenase [Marinifilaceae bacterium]